jgi:XisH protein
MSRKDRFHEAVRHALEKENWLITHDPFTIQISEAVKLKIDLGAESTIAAQVLHLAVPLETYNDFFQLPFIQKSLKRHEINLIVYDPIPEEIRQWISYSSTDK